jgi:hypothetical protein
MSRLFDSGCVVRCQSPHVDTRQAGKAVPMAVSITSQGRHYYHN